MLMIILIKQLSAINHARDQKNARYRTNSYFSNSL